MSHMKIGMMNNPRLSVYKEIEAIGRAGFDFVDLTIEGPRMKVEPEKARKHLAQFGLSAVGHTDPCLPYAYPVDSVRRACFDELERCAKIFSLMGARVMNIHPCYAAPPCAKGNLVKENIKALKPISRMAQDHGLTLVLENFKAPFDRVTTFETLFSEIPALGLHLDFGHTNIGKDTPQTFCRSLGQKVTHVHLSDNRGSGDDHMPLGAGNMDWRKSVDILKATGYDGTLTLEIFCGNRDVLFQYVKISKNLLLKLWNS